MNLTGELIAMEARNILADKGLKVTPQRVVVLESLLGMRNHPTAETIIGRVKDENPNIATGTIYKILDAFVLHNIIKRVKSDRDIMRYDAFHETHHHLYCSESDRIEDYFDDELNNILEAHFIDRSIPNFRIEDIKLQINGKFLNK